MDGVESVEQIDDTKLHWVAKIGGVHKEWDAEITQQEPDQRVAWKSTTGADNGGAVDFHRTASIGRRRPGRAPSRQSIPRSWTWGNSSVIRIGLGRDAAT